MLESIRRALAASFLAALAMVPAALPAAGTPRHGIAMHGDPALPPDFTAFPYVNPDAPKGGRIVIGVQGTFDGMNPFIAKGVSASQGITGPVIETLMRRSLDEPFTLYGLIARSIDVPDDRSWVVFHIDPDARFSDGQPVTARDVLFSFDLLKAKGRPQHRSAFSRVRSITAPDALTVRYDLAGLNDRELPLILALMPVLPEHGTDAASFEATGLKPLLGSGPYVVADVDAGQSVLYRRNPEYWGRNLPSNRGMWNADEIRYDYYRDGNSLFEAFKTGLYDLRIETDPGRWLTGYDIPAVAEGRIVKESVPITLPSGMIGFVFNTRRGVFADGRVREALGLMFDFEWVNRNLYGGLYERSGSYFDGSDLSARGRPADAAERAFLARFPGAVREDILEGRWQPSSSDGSGRDRDLAQKAIAKLKQAGFTLRGGHMVDREGATLSFEIMVVQREHERLALNYAQSLARIGVEVRVRLVDSVQYERRRQRFEFDTMVALWPASPSPGNEQLSRFSSRSADAEASFNYAGVKSPAVDAAIAWMLSARERSDFVSAVRSLDRLLLSGFYVVPLFHAGDYWTARSARIGRPAQLPLFGVVPNAGIVPEILWRQP